MPGVYVALSLCPDSVYLAFARHKPTSATRSAGICQEFPWHWPSDMIGVCSHPWRRSITCQAIYQGEKHIILLSRRNQRRNVHDIGGYDKMLTSIRRPSGIGGVRSFLCVPRHATKFQVPIDYKVSIACACSCNLAKPQSSN